MSKKAEAEEGDAVVAGAGLAGISEPEQEAI